MGRLNLVRAESRYKIILGILLVCSVAYGAKYFQEIQIDNLNLNANTISSTDSNGNINITPNGTGEVNISSPGQIGDGDGEITHVIGGVSLDSSLEVHSSGGADLGGLAVHRHVDSAILGAHILGIKSRGTHAAATVVQDDDVIMRFVGAGYDGTDHELATEIRFSVDGVPADDTTDMPGRIGLFATPDGGNTPVEGYRLASDLLSTFYGTVLFNTLTATTVPYLDASKQLTSSAVTPTELGYVSGATSAIQTQINAINTFDKLSPMTTSGDIIYGGASGTGTRLGIGSDNEVLTLASGVPTWAAATGSGGGSKNYIGNPDFEADTDTATTAVGVSTSNAGLTILVNSTTPLEKTQDLILKKTATDMSDEYFTFDSDTVDLIDRGKTMTASIAWEPSGTYTDGFLVIEAVDQSAGALAVISDFTSNGLPNFTGTVQFRIQTTTSTTEVNLRLVYSDATASAEDIGTIDEIKIGPTGAVPGYIGTEWKDWTPTGSWVSNTTYTGKRRRVGDNLEMMIKVATSGAPTATTLKVDLPSGLTIDTAKVIYTSAGDSLGGSVVVLEAGVKQNTTSQVEYEDTNTVRLTYDDGIGGRAYISNSSPFTWGANDIAWMHVKVPISGWKATALISTTEALNMTSEITASGNGGEVITANSEDIVFTEVTDEQDLYDGAVFTAPKNGMYNVAVGVHITASTSFDLLLYKNGSKEKSIFRVASNTLQAGATNVKLVKGDTISIRTNAGFTLTNTVDHNLVIKEIASVSAYSTYNNEEFVDTVSMVRLHTANGHGSSSTKIKRFTTTVVDTGASITYADSATLGSTFTINRDGVYAITFTDASSAASIRVGLSLNSSELTTNIYTISAADRLGYAYLAAAGENIAFSWTGSLSVGDVIRPHTNGLANGTAAQTAFTITRIK